MCKKLADDFELKLIFWLKDEKNIKLHVHSEKDGPSCEVSLVFKLQLRSKAKQVQERVSVMHMSRHRSKADGARRGCARGRAAFPEGTASSRPGA